MALPIFYKMLLILLSALSSCVSDKPYHPDIKVGIIQKADKCKKAVNEDSLVYAHVEARISDQALPIISTYKSDSPIRIKISSKNIIPGFKKGLLGACKGEIRRITIPPALAYGSNSIDGLFPPYSTFVVNVEIVEIVDSSSH